MTLKKYSESRITQYFGENTFSIANMKERLAQGVYDRVIRAVRFHEELTEDVADAVAAAMKEWALAKGVFFYTHWFQPLTQLTAEKHDALIAYGPGGQIIENFTGSQLVMSEPDASSFPHGGMRSSFEARGYAAWDPSSPAFIMEGQFGKILYLPSVFVSYEGFVLDKKTPLIKSIQAVSVTATRLLRMLGYDDVSYVHPLVGAEQEYFLVDQTHFENRPDLRILGYTLFGARAPKGQQFEDHYFGAIRERVLSFMQELEIELFRLGIPVKTRHNEVAPNQFELATLPEDANIASDHNQLVMEMLRRVARRHRLAALLHEKPFARINGSGKHNNWSLVDSNGINLFEPGTNKRDNLRFLCFLLAAMRGVQRHGDILRAIIAGPGNDYRLGMHEAPPATISMFLGQELNDILQGLEQGNLDTKERTDEFHTGIPFIPRFPKDTTDRNRTSPFAFTGNKFEFRAVGSSVNIAMPNTIINTVVAESLHEICDAVEQRQREGQPLGDAVREVLAGTYQKAKVVQFEGDNYSSEWHEEARRRGLPIAAHTPAALDFLLTEDSLHLLESQGVLRREEVVARHRIKNEIYVNTVELELRIARSILRTLILPAAFQYQQDLSASVSGLAGILPADDLDLEVQRDYVHKISSRIQHIIRQLADLDRYNEELKSLALAEQARICAEKIRPAMLAVREVVDSLEERVDQYCWRMPRYWEMLSGL